MQNVRSVFERVVSHVGGHTFTPEQLSQPLVELNIDSVELLEIFGMMEEELGILLSEEEVSGMATLNELLDVVCSKVDGCGC